MRCCALTHTDGIKSVVGGFIQSRMFANTHFSSMPFSIAVLIAVLGEAILRNAVKADICEYSPSS